MTLTPVNLKKKGPKNLQDGSNFSDNEEEIEIVDELDEEDEDEETYNKLNPDDSDLDDIELLSDDDEEDDEPEDEDDDEELVAPPARGPRENERIRTLVEDRKKTKLALAEERKARIKLQKDMLEMQKTTATTGKSMLSATINSIKGQMETAMKDEDFTKMVSLQEQLNRAQLDLSAIESWKEPVIEDLEEIEEDEEEVVQETNEDAFEKAPRAVKKWASKNSWFRNPKTKQDIQRQKEAIAYYNILSTDGYTMEDDDTFKLIDKRLNKLGLAKADKTQVESREDSSKRRKKKVSQHIQGGSRQPSTSKQKTKVTLSAEQKNIADLYGMTHAEYARELLKIERANADGRRMVKVFEDQ